MKEKDKKQFLSPSSAGIILICFFLPWVKFSCAGTTKYASGADLGGPLWIVFVSAIAILAAFFYFKKEKQLKKSKPIIILASISSLFIILYKYIRLLTGMKTEFGNITAKDIGFSVHIGGVLTIIALIISLVGIKYLNSDDNNEL